jgi:hypothetical protein
MTTQRDLERALDAFFALGTDEMADRVIEDALVTIDHTPQRRVWSVPRRSDFMNPFARLAVAAAAIVIVAGGAFYLLLPGNRGVGDPPAASPSPSAEPSGSPSASPTAIIEWQTITSERFGYSVDIPADWGESAPTNVLPPDYFPGEPTQYANRWDAPQTHSPWIVIAVRDPEPDESANDWLAGTQAGFAADCYGTPPVEVIVDGEQATRSSGTCLTVNVTGFVQLIHGGAAYTIFVAGAAGDEANLDTIMDIAVSSFRFTD